MGFCLHLRMQAAGNVLKVQLRPSFEGSQLPMKTPMQSPSIGAALVVVISLCGAACSAVTRVPPGQAVAFVKAPKAEFVAEPSGSAAGAVSSDPVDEAYYGPAVEPELPVADFSLPEELAAVENAEAYVRQGNDHLAAGEDRKAVESLKKAVELEPEFSAAWRSLATAYENLGETEKAMEAYHKSKELSGPLSGLPE